MSDLDDFYGQPLEYFSKPLNKCYGSTEEEHRVWGVTGLDDCNMRVNKWRADIARPDTPYPLLETGLIGAVESTPAQEATETEGPPLLCPGAPRMAHALPPTTTIPSPSAAPSWAFYPISRMIPGLRLELPVVTPDPAPHEIDPLPVDESSAGSDNNDESANDDNSDEEDSDHDDNDESGDGSNDESSNEEDLPRLTIALKFTYIV